MYEFWCGVILHESSSFCLHTRYHVTCILTHPISKNIDQLRSIELYRETYLLCNKVFILLNQSKWFNLFERLIFQSSAAKRIQHRFIQYRKTSLNICKHAYQNYAKFNKFSVSFMLIATVFVNFTLNTPVQTVSIRCSAPHQLNDVIILLKDDVIVINNKL